MRRVRMTVLGGVLLLGVLAGCSSEARLPGEPDGAVTLHRHAALECPVQTWEACWGTLRAPTYNQLVQMYNEIDGISEQTQECRDLKAAAWEVWDFFDIQVWSWDPQHTATGDIHLETAQLHISDVGDANNGYYYTTFAHEAAHTLGYDDGPYNNAAQYAGRCLG